MERPLEVSLRDIDDFLTRVSDKRRSHNEEAHVHSLYHVKI